MYRYGTFKSDKQKNLEKKVLVAVLKVKNHTKIAGSGSGPIGQRHGEHWF
jgi:hypothetical protein